MNNNETMFNLIDDYLNNTLDEKTKSQFEAKMAQDSALQHKVEIARLANVALLRNKLFEIKNLTAEIDKEEKKSQTAKKTVATLAGVALVLVATYYFTRSENVQKEHITISETTKEVKNEEKQPNVKARKSVDEPILENEKVAKTVLPKPKSKVEIEKPVEIKTERALEIRDEKLLATPKETLAEPLKEISKKQVGSKVLKDVCANVSIEAFVNTEDACLNEQNGRIQVSGVKGGRAPYKIAVMDKYNQVQTATHLESGNYSVVISDENKCTRTIGDILVKQVDCKTNYEINVGLGEMLDLGEANFSGQLALFDKAGNKYILQDFMKGDQVRWNGTLPNSEVLGGYYLFQIQYENGAMKSGSVTVVK